MRHPDHGLLRLGLGHGGGRHGEDAGGQDGGEDGDPGVSHSTLPGGAGSRAAAGGALPGMSMTIPLVPRRPPPARSAGDAVVPLRQMGGFFSTLPSTRRPGPNRSRSNQPGSPEVPCHPPRGPARRVRGRASGRRLPGRRGGGHGAAVGCPARLRDPGRARRHRAPRRPRTARPRPGPALRPADPGPARPVGGGARQLVLAGDLASLRPRRPGCGPSSTTSTAGWR